MWDTNQDNKILIVDDSLLNRKVLTGILSEEYQTIEAENGKVALELLKLHHEEIAGVVLDLYMPGMDGFEFLQIMYSVEEYKDIPVLVSTGSEKKETEKRALTLGAWDFVSKPYDAEILKFRLKNVIDRSQMTAFKKLKYIMEFDTLTGIYKKEKFFSMTRKMMEQYPEEKFVFIKFDIERFQLVNSFYGHQEGDRLLQYIAGKIKNFVQEQSKGTFGRIEADTFAFCIPYEGHNAINQMVDRCRRELRDYNSHYKLVPACGVYIIEDNSEQPDAMLDNAGMAAKRVKGNSTHNVAFYRKEMSAEIKQEQEIINDMDKALTEEQFRVYFQPKYSLETNKPAGAEALVRWYHPEKGMVMPGKFIPVFEKNGFIAKLDYYMWEKVCQLLRKWLDQDHIPFPISVNVSRANLYNPQIVETICKLVEKYKVPPRLLQLELTESAYMDNPQTMKEFVKSLRSKGFSIHMDDFGNGYSSLSILKDIEIDLLKIDMRFLENTEIAGRGKNIIASIVRMAKWLKIPVLAEGAERKEQVDFLRNIGCEYVQGYYFGKPMPVEEYELLVKGNTAVEEETAVTFNTNDFWEENTNMENFFSSVTQATCIYEYHDGKVEALRVNKAFCDMFGTEDVVTKNSLMDVILPEYHTVVLETFKRSAENKDFAECEYQRTSHNGRTLWINLKLKYLNQVGNRQILFGTLLDITAHKSIEAELKKYKNVVSQGYTLTDKMLVIDDSNVIRQYFHDLFDDRFTVLEAENGKEALELLKEQRVDIILLDVAMPVMDGITFLEHRCNNDVISDIPVIIMTADDTPEQQIKALSMGANDYMVKPFVKELVIRRVENVLESKIRISAILQEYENAVKQARTDRLTQVYNRITAEQMISLTLASYKDDKHALIMLDLDDFKGINDRFGHDFGDLVLQTMAKELKRYFRKNDIVARFGGDEFCVFLCNIPSGEFVLKRGRQFCAHINSLEIGERKFHMTCSMGIAVTTKEARTFEALYKNADFAMYHSKRVGKNMASLYGQDFLI